MAKFRVEVDVITRYQHLGREAVIGDLDAQLQRLERYARSGSADPAEASRRFTQTRFETERQLAQGIEQGIITPADAAKIKAAITRKFNDVLLSATRAAGGVDTTPALRRALQQAGAFGAGPEAGASVRERAAAAARAEAAAQRAATRGVAEEGTRRDRERTPDEEFHENVLARERQMEKTLRERIAVQRRALGLDVTQANEIKGIVNLKAEERRLQREINAQLRKIDREQRGVSTQKPDIAQRAQAFLSRRSGEEDRDASEFQNLGQLIGGGLLTSAKFAIASVSLRGAAQAIGDLVRQAEELQRIFNQIQAQFESIGQGAEFPQFRRDILEIARDTGTAADEVAFIGFQIKGVFGRDTARAIRETAGAVKVAAVTGLELNEVVDSLTAASLAFGISIEAVGDKALGLQERFGVLAKESIKVFGDIGATAVAAGLDIDELGALVGVLQQNSARGGAALAEGLGRILPAIQNNMTGVLRLFANVQGLQADLPDVQQAFAEGRTGDVLLKLAANYNALSKAQQTYVQNLLGGRREAQIIIPILQNYAKINGEIIAGQDDAGKTAQYFNDLMGTLSRTVSRAREEFKQLGDALFRAGLGEILTDFAVAAGALLRVLSLVVNGVAELNRITGGIAPKFLVAVAAVKLLTVVLKALKAEAALAWLARLGGGVAAGTNATGSLVGATAARTTLGAGIAATTAGAGAENLIAGAGGVPTLAIIGTLFVAQKYASERQKNQTQADTLRAQLQDALSENDTERIKTIREMAKQEKGIVDTIGGYLGFEDATDVVKEELRQYDASKLNVRFAAAADAGLKDELDKAAKRQDSFARKAFDFLAAGQPQFKDLTDFIRDRAFGKSGGPDTYDEIVKGLNSNDQEAIDAAQKALAKLPRREQNKLKSRMGEAERSAKIAIGKADIGAAAELALASVESSNRLFELGEITASENEAKIKEELDLLNEVARRSNGQPDPDVANQIATLKQQYQSAVTARVTAAITLLNAIGDLSGDGPEAQLDRLRSALADPTFKDPAARAQVAQQMAQVQRQIIQEQIDALTDTSLNPAQDALSKLTQGTQLDPAARKALQEEAKRLGQDPNKVPTVVRGTPAEVRAATRAADEERKRTAVSEIELAKSRTRDGLEIAELDLEAANIELGFAKTQSEINAANAKVNAAERAVADARLAQAVSRLNLAKTRAEVENDLLGASRIDADIADAEYAAALASGDPIAIQTAQGKRLQAGKQRQDLIRDRSKAALEYLRQVYAGDPVAEARIDERLANLELQAAGKDIAARDRARAAILAAQQAQKEARLDIASANLELLGAYTDNDAIGDAERQQREADIAAQRAVGDAAKARALAQRIEADRAMRRAMDALFDAQQDMLRAMAERTGDTVRIAELNLNHARDELARTIREGGDDGAIQAAQNEVFRQETQLGDSILQKTLDLIDFDLDMGNISKDVAVARLRGALALADSEEEVRNILLKIKQLTESGTDLQFDLPTNLRLPTLYEARRLNQSGGGYQDNRQISVVLAVTPETYDAAFEQVQTLVQDRPARFGGGGSLY